jgi:SRSO17 transposase
MIFAGTMNFVDAATAERLEGYFGRLGKILGNDQRRASFATYAMGILSDAERKSAEPLAARACASPHRADAEHQRLLHFLTDAKWSDREIREEAARYALAVMTVREPVEAWILDDTGFLKQGKHSVGVQRQYTGSAGKVANCQVGVSLTVATRTEQLPIDFELYLPDTWANDPVRRKEGRIPDEVVFKTKPELGLQMVEAALKADVPRAIVLADAGYGSSKAFRARLRQLGLDYAVGVNSTSQACLFGKNGKAGKPQSLKTIASSLNAQGVFRRCTWRQGSKGPLTARFVRRQVQISEGEIVTLLIEWRDRETEPANYFFISISDTKSTKQLVRLVMQRWRIERTYEDLKGELGLDHYEGRRFPGWHHHISVVLCCYSFVTAEKSRHFPPSARGSRPHPSHPLPPGAPLQGQLHHCPSCSLPLHLDLAPALSELPPKSAPDLNLPLTQ